MTHPVNRKKQILARLLCCSGLCSAGHVLQRAWFRSGFVRIVNYHRTPTEYADSFEKQLQFYAGRYSDVSLEDLKRLVSTGVWHKKKPGLLMSFDDGFYSNYSVAVPLLEKYDRTGWFFVPSEWIEQATCERAEAESNSTGTSTVPLDDDASRAVMNWDELREVASRHVVGCHTSTHFRLCEDASDEQLEYEICDSREQLQRNLGQKVESFCWVRGDEASYSRRAAEQIHQAGYEFGFMTNNAPVCQGTHPLQLQRTNVEAHWDLDVVKFQLSGVMDLMYAPKRQRVNRLTRVEDTNSKKEGVAKMPQRTTHWASFWESQNKPLHASDTDDFYASFARELKLLFADQNPSSVLDIGCGDGALYEHLGFDRVSRYRGVDLAQSMLDEFQNKHPGVDLVQSGGESYEDDQKYDLVFSCGVIQYFSASMLREHLDRACRMLNPGGQVICAGIPWRSARHAFRSGYAVNVQRPGWVRRIKATVNRFVGEDRMGRWYEHRELFENGSQRDLESTFFGSMHYPYRMHVVYSSTAQQQSGGQRQAA